MPSPYSATRALSRLGVDDPCVHVIPASCTVEDGGADAGWQGSEEAVDGRITRVFAVVRFALPTTHRPRSRMGIPSLQIRISPS